MLLQRSSLTGKNEQHIQEKPAKRKRYFQCFGCCWVFAGSKLQREWYSKRATAAIGCNPLKKGESLTDHVSIKTPPAWQEWVQEISTWFVHLAWFSLMRPARAGGTCRFDLVTFYSSSRPWMSSLQSPFFSWRTRAMERTSFPFARVRVLSGMSSLPCIHCANGKTFDRLTL